MDSINVVVTSHDEIMHRGWEDHRWHHWNTVYTKKKKNEENITHKLHKMDKLEITSWEGMIASSYYLKHKFYKKA